MLLDEFIPQYQFREHHHTLVKSDPELLFQSIQNMDFNQSRLIRPLFRIREIPWKIFNRRSRERGFGHTLNDMIQLGFIRLADDPPCEICFGVVGRFWHPVPDIVRISSDEFRQFNDPGYAKAAMNFFITPMDSSMCRLTTETRVCCLNDTARKRFRRYWTMIRPFSGLIRKEMLMIAKRSAEAEYAKKGVSRCS